MRKVLIPAAALLAVALMLSTRAIADHHEGEAKATIGKAAPDFSLQDQNGKTVKLSDTRARPSCSRCSTKAARTSSVTTRRRR